jgi:hypothetical protein
VSGLRLLDRLNVLPVLLPESLAMKNTDQPEPHVFDVWEHSLQAVGASDVLLARLEGLEPFRSELLAHLGEAVGDGLTRRETLKLAVLLHDVAKPETNRGGRTDPLLRSRRRGRRAGRRHRGALASVPSCDRHRAGAGPSPSSADAPRQCGWHHAPSQLPVLS